MATSKTDRPTFTTEHIKADVDEVVFLGNPVLDNLMSTVIALGGEIWSTKRRMKILESLLEEKGVTQEMIEAYVPSEAQVSDWQAERDTFVKRTYRYLERDGSKSFASDWDES